MVAKLVAEVVECTLSVQSPELVCGYSRGVLRQSANKIKKQSGRSESLPEKGCTLGTKEQVSRRVMR